MQDVKEQTLEELKVSLRGKLATLYSDHNQVTNEIDSIEFDLLETMLEEERDEMEMKLDRLHYKVEDLRERIDGLTAEIEQLERF